MANSQIDLLDVNVWIALSKADHAHHDRANEYWANESKPKLAFCRLTALSFLRLVTQPATMNGRQLTSGQAWDTLRRYLATPGVTMIPEPSDLEVTWELLSRRKDFPQKMWTDSCIAAWAIQSEARLVSFDRGFARFPGLDFLRLDP